MNACPSACDNGWLRVVVDPRDGHMYLANDPRAVGIVGWTGCPCTPAGTFLLNLSRGQSTTP